MQLTKHFKIDEFRCNDGTDVPYNLIQNIQELANNYEKIRKEINKKIIIISGYRNPTYNEKVGGSPKSQHMKAKAGDSQVEGWRPLALYRIIEMMITAKEIEEGGLGLYDNFVHYDIRKIKTRWNYSKGLYLAE